MKLIAVYNVFDGEEFLERSVDAIREHVDMIICVVQNKAYNGFKYNGGIAKVYELLEAGKVDYMIGWEGNIQLEKRQRCLDVALEHGATHFIGMDCDEVYNSNEFKIGKDIAMKHNGSYCRIKTYFKREDLTIGMDNYFVPFIHKVEKGIKTGGKGYPVLVDPRRAIVNTDVIELPIIMHHYSWVRDDISIKVNSHDSAHIIKQNGLLEDYEKAELGSYIRHYDKKLKRA